MRLLLALLVIISVCASCVTQEQNQAPTAVPPSPVKVPENVASSLLVQKTPVTYPTAARDAGIQGTVTLRIIINAVGDVKEVTVVSGDSVLAEAASQVVGHWKYKPFILEGKPIEVETEVNIKFHLKQETVPSPSLLLGVFSENAYFNKYFDLDYPLPRDWVRETELLRKKFVAEGLGSGVYVLLAAVHIPEHTAPLEADSSFVLSAIQSSPGSRTENCKRYLESLATDLNSRKEAQQKGDVAELNIGPYQFARADFRFRRDPSYRATVCTQAKGYLLLWNITGLSTGAIGDAVSTLNSITPLPPAGIPEPQADQAMSGTPKSLRIPSTISKGLKVKEFSLPIPKEPGATAYKGQCL